MRKWPRSQDGAVRGIRGTEGRVQEQSLRRQLCTQRRRPFPPANSAASFCSLNPGLHRLQSFTETPRMFPTSPYNLCPSLRHIFPNQLTDFCFIKCMFGGEVG